ncbi:hypothetical protein ACTJJ0_03490 [Chitinophaga sp. 22321]|uniref:Uncharacterized protein n=1 Tax=Chitinophaga hostae TaxID=2831022 RepID=A0ABS5IXM2_9BACT|nr:hypothetical protein [Chitinophaga hostae]MBS0027706.1 hypothetical protein [Chitinophaga hostae]
MNETHSNFVVYESGWTISGPVVRIVHGDSKSINIGQNLASTNGKGYIVKSKDTNLGSQGNKRAEKLFGGLPWLVIVMEAVGHKERASVGEMQHVWPEGI